MKTFISVLPMALMAFLFLSSCDDSLLDVEEDFTFQHEFIVYSEDPSVNIADVVNLAEKVSVINEYGSKIKEMKLNRVHYWLKSHTGSGEQTVTSLTLNVANANGTDSKNLVQLQNVVLSGLLNNPTELNTHAAGVQKLADLMSSSPHTLMFDFAASIDETPADFTVVFEFEMTMTANPLS